MRWPLFWLLSGSLLDGAASLLLFERRITIEQNPILAKAYEVSPLAFVAVKLALMAVVVLALVWTPQRRLKWWVAVFGAVVFYAVFATQVVLLLWRA